MNKKKLKPTVVFIGLLAITSLHSYHLYENYLSGAKRFLQIWKAIFQYII